ncbi:MAG: NAD(P)-dependent alcohol dehydrogenase [Thermoleophilia bacterium]|nr:NAD(P)-dependent alcohol dehydrogenase [Thermoleophilia bacterium]
MRAAFHDRYGPPEVLRVEELERPAPKADELLVRIHASTVNLTDCHMRGAYPPFWRFLIGFRAPKPQFRIAGREFAGVVEEVGADVTEFEPGDRVFGRRLGANAEYLCVRDSGLVTPIPAGLTFEEAAGTFDGFHQGLTPMQRARVGEGTRLLVYGASGACGTAAVQLGKHFGAHVTAVCNTKNVDLVRALGADEVIDYLHEDFTKRREAYDVVLDAVGMHSFLRSRRALKRPGLFVATDRLVNFPLALLTRWSARRVVFTYREPDKADLLLLAQLLEAGEYRPVIDSTYPLDRVVEAHRYVETRQKTGNVVVTLDGAAR